MKSAKLIFIIELVFTTLYILEIVKVASTWLKYIRLILTFFELIIGTFDHPKVLILKVDSRIQAEPARARNKGRKNMQNHTHKSYVIVNDANENTEHIRKTQNSYAIFK